jgi:hypothetical protein
MFLNEGRAIPCFALSQALLSCCLSSQPPEPLVLVGVYAVLDVDEAKELFEKTTKTYLAPREPLFYAGG